jgi:hypothetical protein
VNALPKGIDSQPQPLQLAAALGAGSDVLQLECGRLPEKQSGHLIF